MWLQWLDANVGAYWDGGEIQAPDWLGPPSQEGFRRLPIATEQGQCSDWGLALSDGSRIHVHEFCDGERKVHRDKYDPDHSLANMAAHIMLETPWGPLIAVGGLLFLLARSN